MTLDIRLNKRFLLIVFALSFLVRGLVFNFYLSQDKNYWQVDSGNYHDIALSISQGAGISDASGKPNFYRLPGYPLFLAPFYQVFGESNGVKIALWVQVLIASLIPLLIFCLAIRLFRSILIAKAASLWSVFHIGLTLYSGFLMTETLFIVFFLLFAVAFLKLHLFFCEPLISRAEAVAYVNLDDEFVRAYLYNYCPEPGCEGPSFISLFFDNDDAKVTAQDRVVSFPPYELFVAGLLLGVAGLIRPVGHYFFVLSALMIFFSNTERVKGVMTLFGGWIFPTSLWLIRNYALLGQIFFHTLPGGHFLYLSASRVAMHTQNVSYWQARENLSSELTSLVEKKEQVLGRGLNEIEQSNVAEGLAVQYFKKYPLIAAKNWVVDIIRTGLSLYCAELLYLNSSRKKVDYFKKERSIWDMFSRYLYPQTDNTILRLLVMAEIISYLFILIGFALGLAGLFFSDYFIVCSWIRSLLFMGLFLVISIAGGYARMRLPIEPFLIILSMSYWTSWIGYRRA